MPTVSATGATRRDTPLRSNLRTRLHDALDELLDASDELEAGDASAADVAFVTLLKLARTRSTAKAGGAQ